MTEYLDIGVNASGKLLVLDKILQMIQNQGLRVLILFQVRDICSFRFAYSAFCSSFRSQGLQADVIG